MPDIQTLSLATLQDLWRAPYDTIIDVRSPAEFAEDHVPGAVNLAALSNAQRAEVGTIYVQDSRFRARKIGAAYVARNVADYLATELAEKDGAWRPLVYCWRGGQRSGSVATILAQIGWRVGVVAGGYRSYRAQVVDMLRNTSLAPRLIVIDGNTGTAKTEVLHALAARGWQMIDLEGLAAHRGSLFGHRAGGQPSQKWFEGQLAAALSTMDPARPVLVEAESNKIGDILIPGSVWSAMRAAPRIELRAPPEARAQYLATAYGDLTADRDALRAVLAKLVAFHGHAQIAEWDAMAVEGAFAPLAQSLMALHYDPRYGKSRARQGEKIVAEVTSEQLDPDGIARLADGIEAAIARMDMAVTSP